jgi:hypothetical protein
MRPSAAPRWRLWAAFLAALFAFGLTIVSPRAIGARSPALRMRGDAAHYVALASGVPPSEVMVPFRYRVLVPWVAGSLPLPPHRGLQLLSMVCLAGAVLGTLLIGARLGFERLDTVLGVAGVASMASILYAFHNPFLIDQFGLLMVTGALAALLLRLPLLFAVLVTVGSLGREAVAFVAPAYLMTALLSRDRQGREGWPVLLLGIVLPVVGFFALRVLPGFGGDGLARYAGFYERTLQELGPVHQPVEFIIGLAMAWEWLWPVSLGGLALFGSGLAPPSLGPAGPRWYRTALRTSFTLIVAGGVATVAANGMLDANRQLLGLAPVMAVGAMTFVHAVRRTTSRAAFLAGVAGLAGCSLATVLVQLPNRVISESTANTVPLWAITATSLTIVVFGCLALRRAPGTPAGVWR